MRGKRGEDQKRNTYITRLLLRCKETLTQVKRSKKKERQQVERTRDNLTEIQWLRRRPSLEDNSDRTLKQSQHQKLRS